MVDVNLQSDNFSDAEQRWQQAPALVTPEMANEAHWSEAEQNMPTAAISEAISNFMTRQEILSRHQGEPDTSVEDLNARFPGLDKPFTEPMNLYLANDIAQKQYDKQNLQKKIQMAPQESLSGLKDFGRNMLLQALDPTNLLAGFGLGKAITAGMFGAKLSTAMGVEAFTHAAPTLGQVFTRSLVEGGIANTVGQIPEAIAAKQELRNYDPYEAVANVAAGTLGMGLLFTGIHGIGLKLSPEQVGQIHDVAESQIRNGNPVEVQPLIKTIVSDNKGSFSFMSQSDALANLKEAPQYKYEPFDTSIMSTKGKIVYHGTKSDLTSLESASPSSFGDVKSLYGEGLYLTDNPEVAKSYATNKGSGAIGNVLSARLNDLNLINLEKSLPDNVISNFNKYLPEDNQIAFGTKGTAAYDMMKESFSEEGLTNSDVAEIYQELNRNLSDLGYDGFRHEGGANVKKNLGKHNVFIIFDNIYKNKETGVSGKVVDVSPKELSAQIASPQNQMDYSPTIENVLKEKSRVMPNIEYNNLQSQHDALLKQLSEVNDAGLLDSHSQEELKNIQDLGSKQADIETWKKAAIDCIGRNG